MSERAARAALAALLVAFVAGLGGLAAWKHTSFLTQTYDLALYAQALHQFARGSTYVSINYAPFLGIHTHWVHFLLTPLAWAGGVPALLVLQAVAVAAGAAGLFRYARLRDVEPGLALMAAGAFLASPLIQFPALFAYHPEVLGVAFVPWAAVFLEQRRFGPFLAACLLLAACKETCGVLLVGMAGLALARRRPPEYAAAAGALGMLTFVGGMLVVQAFNTSGVTGGSFFGPLGDGPSEVLWTLASRPLFAAQHLATASRGLLLLALLGGAALLPLLRPAWALAAAPFLAIHLLAAPPTIHSIRYHYHALVVTCLALASVEALGALRRERRRVAGPLLMGAALVLHGFASPILELPLWGHGPALRAHRAQWSRVVAALPPERGVAAPIAVAAHLADRDALYLINFVVHGLEHLGRRLPLDPAVDYVISEAPGAQGVPLRGWLERAAPEPSGWVPCLEGPLWVYRRGRAPELDL